MSTQTAEPPAVPVALLLSPILWQLNLPDRFDLWSAGLILLQMCLPSLRTDGALIGMRKALDRNGQDVAVRSRGRGFRGGGRSRLQLPAHVLR